MIVARILSDGASARQMQRALDALYGGQGATPTGRETLAMMKALARIDPAAPASRAARYPDSEFGHGLRQTALLAKAQIGLEVAAS